MFAALLLGGVALSAPAPCPEVRTQVEVAWTVFLQGELEQAQAQLDQAETSLLCQSEPLYTEDLVELYRLPSAGRANRRSTSRGHPGPRCGGGSQP